MKKMGFGCMRLPLEDENNSKSINIDEVKEMVDVFMENGYNYFDTGYQYHDGDSEKAIKEAIVERYPRDSFLIADKMPIYTIKKQDQPEKIFNEQLERLGVDYIDYYLMHNVSGFSEAGYIDVDSFGFVKKQIEEGRIKHFGMSTHANAEYIENILEKHPEIEFIQLQINYLDWESEQIESRKCYEVARKHNLPIIVMEPLKGGFLADLKEDELKLLKEVNNDSPTKWALRFVANLEGVMLVLSGVSSLKQMKENIEVFENLEPLSEEELETLKKVADLINSKNVIECTKCNYCVEYCPQNINIPKLFDLYNSELIEGKKDFSAFGNAYVNYTKLDGVGWASDCIECNACVEKCPQHLNIPEYMKDVAKLFETEHYGFKDRKH